MILRYLGTHLDDFWCYGTVHGSGSEEIDRWRIENARSLQTKGPEIWVAWGKLKQIKSGTIHIKRGQFNNRFHHKLREKSRKYYTRTGPHLDHMVPDIIRIMDQEVLAKVLTQGPVKGFYT